MLVLHVPPPPQILDRPGTIRWAVGSPAGPRSHTWNVVGHATRDDVFIGLRDRMDVMKLSLHEVKWRMAYDEKWAERHVSEGVDRVLTRWKHPPELAPGWCRGAVITIATSNLGPGYPDKKGKGRGKIAFFPAPSKGWAMRFDVLLGAPDHGELTINDCVGDVGRMTMSSGAAVWIVANEFPVDAEDEVVLAELRRRLVESTLDPSETRGLGWGWLHDDDAPALIDLSNLDDA